MTDAPDLDALMAKDPLEMTREDIDKIIDYYRKRRAAFVAKGPKAPRAKKETGPKLSLADLGINIAPSKPTLTFRKLK